METLIDATPSPRLPWRYRLFRLLLRFFGWLLFDIRIHGRSHIPAGNYIVVANHLNWIDPFLLLMALPAEPRVYFIGARQIANRPWKTRLLHSFDGLIPVERGARWVGKDILERPLGVLRSGAVLALFPEGDNGPREGELAPLKPGIGHFVLLAPCPILPVALSGVQDLYWRKRIEVSIGEPFEIHVEERGHARIQAATREIERRMRSILPPYHEPRAVFKPLHFLTNLLG